MEELKRLNEIIDPDPRHGSRQELRARLPENLRPDSLADLHAEMRQLALPEHVPETVRSAFAVTRNLWIYGWFCWPFHTVALREGLRCVEMALKARCQTEGLLDRPGVKKTKNASLGWLLDQALRHQWIKDLGFENFRRHGRKEAAYFLPPGTVTHQSQNASDEDPRWYSRRLAESLRAMRNREAHPDGHWHGMPSWGSLYIEIVHDLIVQLFRPTE